MQYAKLQEMQRDLDKFILDNEAQRGVTHTPEDLLMHTLRALRNELAELENEMSTEPGMFKHWRQRPMDLVKAREEWADCLHFITSVFNQLKIQMIPHEPIHVAKRLPIVFDYMYLHIHKTMAVQSVHQNIREFLTYLMILADYLGLEEGDILKQYTEKWEENKRRQREGY